MMNRIIIAKALTIVITNLLVGHFFAPIGMKLTPIILVIVTAIVCYKTNAINPILLSIITFGLIGIHDIGIKLYSGGSHDSQGLGWINVLLFFGLIPSYLILTITIIKDKRHRLAEKVIAAMMFPILIAGHLYLFGNLGLGRYYGYEWN